MKLTIAEIRKIVRDIAIDEIIKKVDDEWCLYSSKKGKDGKRKRLGCHKKKEDAYKQEYAIEKSKERQ